MTSRCIQGKINKYAIMQLMQIIVRFLPAFRLDRICNISLNFFILNDNNNSLHPGSPYLFKAIVDSIYQDERIFFISKNIENKKSKYHMSIT